MTVAPQLTLHSIAAGLRTRRKLRYFGYWTGNQFPKSDFLLGTKKPVAECYDSVGGIKTIKDLDPAPILNPDLDGNVVSLQRSS